MICIIKINITDKLYPNSLKMIHNPPKCLYLEGNINLLTKPSIAIIGSRNFSENGRKIAEKFATELSMSGVTVISGLAKGIDSCAHQFSYKNNGKTIAVLGSGLERIFPQENIPLSKDILNESGLIISEYPPKEFSSSKHFLDRNRIISGLSLGVLVVEATYRSGTSVTAKHAMKQGRPVFSVPHEIWDSHGVGTNQLLKKGAKIVTSSLDILEYLKLTDIKKNFLKLKEDGIFNNLLHIKSSNNKISSKKLKQNSSNLSSYEKNISMIKDENSKKIYNIIYFHQKVTTLSELVEQSKFPVNDIFYITFMLEINGYIKKIEGGYICI